VKWQFKWRRLGNGIYGLPQLWIDYTPNYNILLEAAWVARLPFVVLEAPEGQAAQGDCYCDLETLVQRNTSTGVRRNMRREPLTGHP
jgi:hypothetical protein